MAAGAHSALPASLGGPVEGTLPRRGTGHKGEKRESKECRRFHTGTSFIYFQPCPGQNYIKGWDLS